MKVAALKQKESVAGHSDKGVIEQCKAFKEAGFKPKMVYRNLPPSHLYEKVWVTRNSRLCNLYYESRNCLTCAG